MGWVTDGKVVVRPDVFCAHERGVTRHKAPGANDEGQKSCTTRALNVICCVDSIYFSLWLILVHLLDTI